MATPDWKPVIDSLVNKKADLALLHDECGKKEITITPILFDKLGWRTYEKKIFKGLFGQQNFGSDHIVKLLGINFVVEVKKVTEGKEYGFWHSVIQGLLYQVASELEGEEKLPVLCIILDWGRAANRPLNKYEQEFLNWFKNENIFCVRFKLTGYFIIEHNLLADNDEWDKI